jgi:hypothetical protein
VSHKQLGLLDTSWQVPIEDIVEANSLSCLHHVAEVIFIDNVEDLHYLSKYFNAEVSIREANLLLLTTTSVLSNNADCLCIVLLYIPLDSFQDVNCINL